MMTFGFFFALAAAAAAPAAGPSFDCARATERVETLICGDERLAAYDRALALLYRQSRRRDGADDARRSQRQWVARERARCTDVDCLAEAYQARIEEVAELALGEWGARFTSKPNRGTLEIAALGGGWHLVRIDALWIYPGGGNANTGGASGILRLEAGHGELAAGGCRLAFDESGREGWRVRELGEDPDPACGGLNVTLTGLYRRSR